jgi:hypothetical protein
LIVARLDDDIVADDLDRVDEAELRMALVRRSPATAGVVTRRRRS